MMHWLKAFLVLLAIPLILPESLSIEPSRAYRKLLEKADSFLYSKKYEEALKTYDEAIELDPTQSLAYLKAGEFFLNIRFFSNANTFLQKAIKLDPDEDRGQYFLARIFLASGQREEALEYISRALERNDSSWEYQSWLGRVQLEMGKPADALKTLDQALAAAKLDFQEKEAVFELERRSVADQREAPAYFDEQYVNDAMNDGSWNNEDWNYIDYDLMDRNYDRGDLERSYRILVQARLSLSEVRFHKALALLKMGRKSEGLKAFGESIFHQESSMNLGMCQYFVGKYEEAAKNLKRVGIANRGSSALLCQWLSYERVGDKANAKKILSKLKRESKSDASGWLVPVLTYYKSLKPELDINGMGEGRKLKLDEKFVVAFYEAQMHLLKGDTEGAKSLLNRASSNILFNSHEIKAAQIQKLLIETG